MVESIKELRKIVQENRKDGDWEKKSISMNIIYRKLSIYFTYILLHTGISANQTTFLSIIISLIGAGLLAFNNYGLAVIGVLILELGYILDCSDGEIARYKKTTGSPKGVFLDLIGHNIVNTAIFAGISYSVFAAYNNSIIFVFGFLAALFFVLFHNHYGTILQARSTVQSYAQDSAIINIKVPNKFYLKKNALKGKTSILWRFGVFIVSLFNHPNIIHLLLFATVLNRLDLFLFAAAFLLPIEYLGLMYVSMKGKDLQK